MNPVTPMWVKSLITLLVLSGIGGIGYLGYQVYRLTQVRDALETNLSQTKQDFASTTASLLGNIDSLRELLAVTQGEKQTAEQDILKQKELVDSMSAQVEFISNTLGVYKKIVATDRELLEKYSRVYFLNENYVPKYLTVIPPIYTYDKTVERTISTDVWPFLQKLLDDALTANVDLKISSSYRSFGVQSTLKSTYKVTYGSGANKFSADQGYSEHQLGTTVDFSTSKQTTTALAFEKTPSFLWLAENAYKYGFILSYPKNNTYYIYEPWHWRFVGKSLALKLHDEHKYFYDMPQRDINEYLVSLFDL